MRVEIERDDVFSDLIGQEVDRVTLKNNKGMSLQMLTYGGIMVALNVPDRLGVTENVLITYDTVDEYLKNPMYLNAIIGPNAGRIRSGELLVDGVTYNLEINNGISNLHGGSNGFHTKVWKIGQSHVFDDSCQITLVHKHKPEHDGFPGTFDVYATFTLDDEQTLKVQYESKMHEWSHLNMTNHNYFNLSGNEKRKIDEQLLFINSTKYRELDANGVPFDDYVPTKGSDFDFTEDAIVSRAYVSALNGMDHPFDIEMPAKADRPAVVFHDPVSGRMLEIVTNQKSVVIYTTNTLHKNHHGICFEAQYPPNQFNLLNLDTPYYSETVYKFTIND